MIDRRDMLPARDKSLSLFRVEQFGGDALGVLKDINGNAALVAILGVNASLFDIMPAELRVHSEVILALSNGEKLGEFLLYPDKALQVPIDLDKNSTRFPLHATIRLERGILSTRGLLADAGRSVRNRRAFRQAFVGRLGLACSRRVVRRHFIAAFEIGLQLHEFCARRCGCHDDQPPSIAAPTSVA
ncbi:hypothetical protein [Bradyrhizobium sp. USDA 3650]